jgi:hypothetical protein
MNEGYYWFESPSRPRPVLVYGYYAQDATGNFVFGFNAHDGGGTLMAGNVEVDTVIRWADIREPNS